MPKGCPPQRHSIVIVYRAPATPSQSAAPAFDSRLLATFRYEGELQTPGIVRDQNPVQSPFL